MYYSHYREKDVEKKIYTLGLYPIDVMITGVTGAGKSTTLNTVFQKPVAAVGDGADPKTMELNSYSLTNNIRLWDTPGLGDGAEKDKIHSREMRRLLNKTYTRHGDNYGFVDMVIVIIEGSNRDMGTTYRLLNDVIIPNIDKDRIVVAINQADMAMKGRHWDSSRSMPDPVLKKYLDQQALSIQRRVKEATGVTINKPVYYSAQYNYNIERFLDSIIEGIPTSLRLKSRNTV